MFLRVIFGSLLFQKPKFLVTGQFQRGSGEHQHPAAFQVVCQFVGCKRIELVGCDLNGFGGFDGHDSTLFQLKLLKQDSGLPCRLIVDPDHF